LASVHFFLDDRSPKGLEYFFSCTWIGTALIYWYIKCKTKGSLAYHRGWRGGVKIWWSLCRGFESWDLFYIKDAFSANRWLFTFCCLSLFIDNMYMLQLTHYVIFLQAHIPFLEST
jgi:hypothetical protein